MIKAHKATKLYNTKAPSIKHIMNKVLQYYNKPKFVDKIYKMWENDEIQNVQQLMQPLIEAQESKIRLYKSLKTPEQKKTATNANDYNYAIYSQFFSDKCKHRVNHRHIITRFDILTRVNKQTKIDKSINSKSYETKINTPYNVTSNTNIDKYNKYNKDTNIRSKKSRNYKRKSKYKKRFKKYWNKKYQNFGKKELKNW